MGVEAEIETLAAEIHEAWEFQYDECTHGLYSGGAMHGEPYAMCEIFAHHIVYRRTAKARAAEQVFDPYGRSADV